MSRISSQTTWISKKAIPVFWFFFLGLFSFLVSTDPDGAPVIVFIILAGFAIFGAVIFWKYSFRLVDEVWLDGCDLIVRKGKREDRIPVTNLKQVTIRLRVYSSLILNEPSIFGSEIFFERRVLTWPRVDEQLRRAYALEKHRQSRIRRVGP